MTGPDLTPMPFIKQMRKHAAIRRWIAPIVLCVLAAVVPIFLEVSKPADRSSQLAQERVTQAQSRIANSEAQLASQSALLAQQERELKAEQHLTSRPDWRAVLMLITRQFDEDLVMAGLQLNKATDNQVRSALGPLASDVPEDSVWLIVHGFAAANSDVPGLIMRFESLGLFERVVMTASQRGTFAGSTRTTFTLACRVE